MGQNKAPIVLLHGWTEHIKKLSKIKRLLEETGYVVFMPTLPGFGQVKPPSTAWGLDKYAEWVHEFLHHQKQKIEEVTVVGHSFGGAVAVKLSVLHPKMVKKLILINSSGIRTTKSHKVRLSYYLARIGTKVSADPFLRKFHALARNALYKILGSYDYLKAQGIMKKVLKKVVQQDLTSDLPKIRCPTLLIWGEKDRVTPLKDGNVFHQLIPNSELIILKGCNHVLPYDHPNKVVKFILGFLDPKTRAPSSGRVQVRDQYSKT